MYSALICTNIDGIKIKEIINSRLKMYKFIYMHILSPFSVLCLVIMELYLPMDKLAVARLLQSLGEQNVTVIGG